MPLSHFNCAAGKIAVADCLNKCPAYEPEGTMKVTIMYRNNYDGGDGWTYYPQTITISDKCPICGGERGKPYAYHFMEDGESFTVSRWDNPCGHIDHYGDCWKEFKALGVAQANKEQEK